MTTDNDQELIFEGVIPDEYISSEPVATIQAQPELEPVQAQTDSGNASSNDSGGGGNSSDGGGGGGGGGSSSAANSTSNVQAKPGKVTATKMLIDQGYTAPAAQYLADKVDIKKVGAAVSKSVGRSLGGAVAPPKPVLNTAPRVARVINKNPTATAPLQTKLTSAKRAIAHGEDDVRAYQIHGERQEAAQVCWELGEEPQFAGSFLPSIVWQGDVYDYLDSTDKQVMSVDGDVTRGNLPKDFLDSWAAFRVDWTSFYKRGKDETHTFDSVDWMNQIDNYVERLKAYQIKMQSLGVAKNVPSVVTSVDSIFNKTQLSKPQILVIAAGAGLAGLVGLKLLKAAI